jgi:hypothetical protein
MSRWRPTPDEERWLAVASRLRLRTSGSEIAARAGGWRVTGPLARIALFVLGMLAAALAWALLDGQAGLGLLASGLAVLGAGEWLIRARRLHGSGVEEALVAAGLVMIVLWGVDVAAASEAWAVPMLALALLLAGLRLLNPLLTWAAAFTFVVWLSREAPGLRVDARLGYATATVAGACLVAVVALGAGAREFRRPSHDRMLDWLVAALPVAAYAYGGGWGLALRPGLLDPAWAGASRGLVPLVLGVYAAFALVVGVRRRAHAPLLGFLGGTACVLLELHAYTGLPAELWLIVCGAAALAAGLVLDRRLREPRDGVTSARLTDRDGPLDLLQLAGASVLAQRDAPAPRPDEGFTPGGGRYGGGGAGGSW